MYYVMVWLICFGMITWKTETLDELLLGGLLITILIIACKTDLTRLIIPNKLIGIAGAIGLLLIFVLDLNQLADHLYGALIAGGILFVVALFTNLGGGDIKLFAVVGLILGSEASLLALLLTSVTGFVYGISLILRRVPRTLNIPLAPSITIGSFMSFILHNFH